MISCFLNLNKYRDLLYMITWREIRIRYKQSIMGFMWAILMPILVISAGILVRFGIARLSGRPLLLTEIVTVSIKALPWSFFISSIRLATNSLTSNSNLVTKIYFPREIFPISAVFSQLFDFLIASCALGIILSLGGIGLTIHVVWAPLLMLMLILLTIGLGVFLSAANLFFRDVKYLVEIFVTFAIFFTPVFYEADLVGRWKWVLLLNPVAPILEGLNDCIVMHRSPDLTWILYSAAFSLGTLLVAMATFKNLEPRFAESI